MDCRLQVSCSGLWEFTVPYSNPVLLKRKNIFWFFIPFMESPSNFKHFQKKKIVIANVFPKLATVKALSRHSLFSAISKHPWAVNILKGTKTSKAFMRALLPYFFITVRRINLENISPTEVWNHRVFVNTWTADYKYPVPDCENLPFPIQIQFS